MFKLLVRLLFLLTRDFGTRDARLSNVPKSRVSQSRVNNRNTEKRRKSYKVLKIIFIQNSSNIAKYITINYISIYYNFNNKPKSNLLQEILPFHGNFLQVFPVFHGNFLQVAYPQSPL